MTTKIKKKPMGRAATIRAWVKALRSGRYKQGRCKLRSTDNTYCCLGVLCQVAGLKQEPLAGGFGYTFDGELGHGYLPDGFRCKLGISIEEQKELTRLNDAVMMDFSGIANFIEAELLKKKAPRV